MIPNLEHKEEKKDRGRFYASDFGKLGIDILLSLRKEEETNPPTWLDTLKWAAGKGVELKMVDILKENGIVEKDFDQEAAPSMVINREGVDISMKFDALVKEGGAVLKMGDGVVVNEEVRLNAGEPIEIKTINNKNSFDIARYNENKPRENYVGQVATYMDALGQERGHIFAVTIDGLHAFWFVVSKIGEGKYQAGDVIVNIDEEYKRYAKIWDVFKSGEIPKEAFFEERYKLPIESIDWHSLSKNAISDARTNKKVIGSENSWKIMYSNFRDRIIKEQGETRGYTEEEIEKIAELTAGYSKW